MGSSSQTPTLLLPQFSDNDKPTWRGDVNDAMSKMDGGVLGVMNRVATLELHESNRELFNVRDYGALPDVVYTYGSEYITAPTANGTDNTTAIRNAITAAAAKDGVVFFPEGPEGSGYRVTGQIVVPSNVAVMMDCPIIADHIAGAAIVWGAAYTAATNGPFRRKSRFMVCNLTQDSGDNTDPTATGATQASIGVNVKSAHWCQIDIAMSMRFGIGVLTEGANVGFDYNKVEFGQLRDNAVHHSAYTSGSSGPSGNGGWHNQNIFYGGSFVSSANLTKKRVGVRCSGSSTAVSLNNNLWIMPSFELGGGVNTPTTSPEATPFEILNGTNNRIENCRLEGNSRVVVRTYGSASMNSLTYLYSVTDAPRPYAIESGTYATTVITDGSLRHVNDTKRLVAHVPNLAQRCTYYDATGGVYVQGLSWLVFGADQIMSRNTNVDVRQTPDKALSISATGASYGGVYVSTEGSKRFVVDADNVAGSAIKYAVFCFDSFGNKINTANSVTSDGLNLVYSAANGGFWYTAAAITVPLFLNVAAGVSYIFVSVTGGTFRALSVYSDGVSGGSWAFGPNDSQLYATISPVRGTYALNTEIKRSPQVVGQPRGWVCTVAGSSSSATWAATTAYTVGQWVKLSGGQVLECVTAGTSGSAEPAYTTLGATIADGTVSWVARASTSATFVPLPNL